jgi:hypothetical protein
MAPSSLCAVPRGRTSAKTFAPSLVGERTRPLGAQRSFARGLHLENRIDGESRDGTEAVNVR